MKKTRLTRKQIAQFKPSNASGEPASLGAAFVCNDSEMGHALNWYNENREVKKMRKFLDAYVTKKFPKKIATIFNSVSEKDLNMTMCAIARMNMAGCKLSANYIAFLDKRIKEVVDRYELVDVVPESRVESFNPAIADTDDILDQFYNSDYKKAPVDFYKILLEKQYKPTEVRGLVMNYEPILEEVKNEADHLTKKEKTNYINFLTQILEDCVAFLSNSRKEKKLRKPRKKKLKSADQLVSKVKFKQSDTGLKITSINPTQIIGAEAVWLYNTKYKRMTYIVAKEKLSIKGTTIIGFDETKSVTKTIRKPEITIPELLNSSKIQMLKQFLALKTKAAVAKGRLNEEILILKASK